MAQNKSQAGMALAQGVERFARLVDTVKDQQLSRTKAGPREAVSHSFSQSPDEAWARKYNTQCIGPVCFGPLTEGTRALIPGLSALFQVSGPIEDLADISVMEPAAVAAPAPSVPLPAPVKAAVPPKVVPRREAKAAGAVPQHIGAVLGKPPPRRGLFGRFFR